jgi:rRNA maturation endonuclease Nob1
MIKRIIESVLKVMDEKKFKLFCKTCDDMVDYTGEGEKATCTKCGKLINPQITDDDETAQKEVHNDIKL